MDPQTSLFILLALVLFILAVLVFQIQKILSQEKKDKAIDLLTRWMQEMRGSMDKTGDVMAKQTASINKRLDEAARYIGALKGELGQLTEFRQQIRDFQDFLRSPKLRGGVGEQILSDLLSQMLPKKSFHLQYPFKNGQIVDAAIKIDQGIIPIDSKFPMENFRKLISPENEEAKEEAKKNFARDVKKHIDDISKKYILPEEGTLEFALMYIPSEPVYYEILNSPELSEYAHEKHVLPVSPNSFYYFLRLIILGMEGRKLEESTRYVLSILRGLKQDASKVDENLGTLTRHIKNASSSVDEINTRFARLSGKISQAVALPSEEKKRLKEPTETEGFQEKIFESKT
jgi:DNA recombination protein RmuC